MSAIGARFSAALKSIVPSAFAAAFHTVRMPAAAPGLSAVLPTFTVWTPMPPAAAPNAGAIASPSFASTVRSVTEPSVR